MLFNWADQDVLPIAVSDNASHSDDPALLAIDGPIATITLNRPAAFNSIDLSIAKKLEELGAQIEAASDIRVLVIQGEGRAFCAGGDLQTIGAAAAADTIKPVVGELLQHYHAFITTLRRMPQIVGSSVAVSPDGGGAVGVVASVGARRALQIFLAEDSFSAAQAHDWGLVVKVVPAAELKAATRELAHRLAQNAPAALAATKALIHQAHVTPVEQQLDAERDGIIACMQTEEFRVAVKKFTSKGK